MRQVEGGTPPAAMYRQLGISEATFYLWKKKFANLGVGEPRHLRQVEDENRRLKQVVADLTLDKQMLSDDLRKNSEADAMAGASHVAPAQVPSVLSVVAKWSRLSPSPCPAFSIQGREVADALDQALGGRPRPRSITVDHGIEFMSRALED